MRTFTSVSAAALAVALASTMALAQSPAGNPSDPSTIENQQAGPSPQRPSDPATGASPSARVPTAPVDGAAPVSPSGDGASTGEAGSYETPAGSPSDPSTTENQQVGPGVANPTDPAAGSDPAARVPTAPK